VSPLPRTGILACRLRGGLLTPAEDAEMSIADELRDIVECERFI